jgi:hypothetical protein
MIKLMIFLFVALPFWGFSQKNGFRYVEYKPAPGQHINIETIGTPEAAQNMTADLDKLVSLGSFGGYIVLQFEQACQNDPQNPYGVDFTIFGNAFSGSSEPGVVWVMSDENDNGQPDDTWYEIAGSNYFHSQTVKNYNVTYFKTETRDVSWKDDQGNTGCVEANSFNTQEYYPMDSLFPEYDSDSVTFEGTLLFPPVDSTNSLEIKTGFCSFGYADNRPREKGADLALPDNPYTEKTEGAGGDPIDISWAVDDQGSYVNLDSIHFVKIVSGALVSAGRLGELSTDVAWIADVEPNEELSDKEQLLVVYHHSKTLLAGDSLQLEAVYFEKGRKKEVDIAYFSQDEPVVKVSREGQIIAVAPGEAEILATAMEESEHTRVKVVIPDSIRLLTDLSAIYPGDSVQLEATVFDNENEKLILPVRFSSSNPAVGEIIKIDGKYYFRAIQPGETNLVCTVEGFSAEKRVGVKVFSQDDKMKVYFTLKTEGKNLFPFQWIEVGIADLNSVVENRQKDYAGLDRLTLFHAMVAGMKKAVEGFQFKDDQTTGEKLYLYQVEEDDGRTSTYTYGWGGKTDPDDFARAWIARLNNHAYINAFDEVEIADGDTLDVYHVSDITASWIYSRLLSGTDSAHTGEEVELRVEETTCTRNGTNITEAGFSPVAQQEILETDSYYTDEYGKVRVTLQQEPPVVFYAANNAILIAGKLATGRTDLPRFRYRVYPNPAKKRMTVEGENLSRSRIVIRDMNGKSILTRRPAGNRLVLNLQSLPSGMYHLMIVTPEQTETRKFIRK